MDSANAIICRDYLMDMCEFVPVRNRCRSLYLHAAACICRRVEFIDGYEMDGETITLSEQRECCLTHTGER